MIVKSLGNKELTKLLEDSIKGEGENIYFSKGDVEKAREEYYNFFEKSNQEERMRSVNAWNTASGICLD